MPFRPISGFGKARTEVGLRFRSQRKGRESLPIRPLRTYLLASLRILRILTILTILTTLAIAVPSGQAQALRLGGLRQRPQVTTGDTLTIAASPSTINITLVPQGTAVASSSITIMTTSTGISLFSSLALYGYFSSASMALSGGSPVSYIPSSVIYGQCATGTPTSYTSFSSTEPVGTASAGLQIYSTSAGLSLGASRTDVLSLEITLATLPQQPAATYTGSLFLQAQAF